MDNTTNSLNWFEIPAVDLDRASKFYGTIFGVEMVPWDEMMGMKMSAFPSDPMNGKVSGALVKSQFHKPSSDGAVIYLNANPKIQDVIDRIENAGGQVIMPRTVISPEIGVMAFLSTRKGTG